MITVQVPNTTPKTVSTVHQTCELYLYCDVLCCTCIVYCKFVPGLAGYYKMYQ